MAIYSLIGNGTHNLSVDFRDNELILGSGDGQINITFKPKQMVRALKEVRAGALFRSINGSGFNGSFENHHYLDPEDGYALWLRPAGSIHSLSVRLSEAGVEELIALLEKLPEV